MNHYKGRVSGYLPRAEGGVFRRRQTLVWDFRLERHDPRGTPLPRVAIELRAKYYRGGSINNGDVVELWGRQSRNGVVRVDSMKNLTAGTMIRAHNWNPSVVILYLVTSLVLLGIVFAVLHFALSGSSFSAGSDGGMVVTTHHHPFR
jgi:hypothetical protein